MRRFLEVFAAPRSICVPSASCVAMMREHYPKMAAESGDPALQAAVDGPAAAGLRVHRAAGRQAGGHRRRRVVSRTPSRCTRPVTRCDRCSSATSRAAAAGGARPRAGRPCRATDECCGFGGTFAVKNAECRPRWWPTRSRAIARDRRRRSARPADNSCLMQIGGAAQPARRRRALRAPRGDPRRPPKRPGAGR